MNLKVIKYKDYGWTMTGGEETDKIIYRFYWSVYELNNGEVIVQQKIENWEGEKLVKTYFEYTYENYELKNGNKREYDFNEDFNTFFDSAPLIKDIKNPIRPTKEEESCIYDFYIKNIIKTPID